MEDLQSHPRPPAAFPTAFFSLPPNFMITYFLFLLLVRGSSKVDLGLPLMLLLLCVLAGRDSGAHSASEQKLRDGIHLSPG